MSPDGYPEEFYSDARKFDSGGKTNPILIPMLRAAMEEVALIDVNCAQQQLKVLMAPLLKWAKEHDYSVSPGPHASHLIGIRPPNRSNTALIKMCEDLKAKGFYVAVRCGGFRISPYLSTTPRDIQRLLEALEEVTNRY
ncbi:unnamed protein product [Cylindrotheca closterium]|uniref:Aminotransferase class V domain-containing protein n=1 Tax=Cylindrotheca closterium TaxID=2856 RepID=A0AAD2GDD1_9STRA|nr:unnamed protein product [Cylindrotheca closterium]